METLSAYCCRNVKLLQNHFSRLFEMSIYLGCWASVRYQNDLRESDFHAWTERNRSEFNLFFSVPYLEQIRAAVLYHRVACPQREHYHRSRGKDDLEMHQPHFLTNHLLMIVICQVEPAKRLFVKFSRSQTRRDSDSFPHILRNTSIYRWRHIENGEIQSGAPTDKRVYESTASNT